MAVDEALMASVREGGAPVLRLYGWSPLCLSLGRHQPAAGHYRVDTLLRLEIDVVRRATGGRAVLHQQELTYAAVVDDRALGSPRRAYRSINEALATGLARLGVPATLAPRAAAAPHPSTAPCFAEPVADEVAAAGVKLIGSAQVRLGGVLLQHGSLPLRLGRISLAELVNGLGAPPPRIALESFLDPLPDRARIIAALAEGWREHIGQLEPSALSLAENRLAAELSRRYRDPEWVWGR